MNTIAEIQCPACNTVFKVPISKIPAKGVKAPCKKCRKPFLVARPPASAGGPALAAAKKGNARPAAMPNNRKASAGRASERKPGPAKKAPAEKPSLSHRSPPRIRTDAQPENPGKKKKILLGGGLAVLILVLGVGAIFYIKQKYNVQVTTKNDNTAAASEPAPASNEPAPAPSEPTVVAQPAIVEPADMTKDSALGPGRVDIGDLFKKVNPAVATVLTYDSGNNPFRQGSGFFISRDGDFITNYHVLKGAYSAVVKFHNDIEYKAGFVLAANEKKDLIKLAIMVPDGILEPGTWLEINPDQPNIADKIIVIGTPLGLGRTVSDGIISAIREIPKKGTAFQMTAPISRGSSGSPVIDMDGRVVGVATFQLIEGQNLNFAIPSINILAMEDKKPLRIAAWTEKVSEDKNENLASLQKEIVKHIKHEKPDKKDEKEEKNQPPQSTNEILRVKMAAEILKEAGIAKQTNSLTEMALASLEEKYKDATNSKDPATDEKLLRLKEVIKLATNSERMNAHIQKNIAAGLTIAELEQVLKWYKSPLGKKIAAIEFSSYSVKKEQTNTLRLAFELTKYQTTSRANLFSRLDEATRSTETMVELQTSLIVQNQILDLVLSESDKVDQEKIDEIIKNFKDEIDPYLDIFTSQYVFAGFVYTYRGLTVSELEEYLAFSETKAARRYYSILKKKSNAALLESNKRTLTSIIRVFNGDSWVNIQKDLNKPIEET